MGHYFLDILYLYTICSRRSDPFYIVSYYIKWVTTSWTYSSIHYTVCTIYFLFFFIVFLIIKKDNVCKDDVSNTMTKYNIKFQAKKTIIKVFEIKK